MDITGAPGDCARGKDIDGDADTEVGLWKLRLSCPRPSAFDSRDICSSIGSVTLEDGRTALDVSTPGERKKVWKILADAIGDSQILGFKLASQVSIESYIQSQTWFTTFTSNSGRQPGDYAKFCSGGIVSMEESGLNQFDSALVIRAAIEQLPQLAPVRSAFTSTKAGKMCVTELADASVTIRQ